MGTSDRQARLGALRQKLEHLRAFEPRKKKKSGRPGKWKGLEGFLLFLAVNSIMKEHDEGIAKAVARLKRRSRRWRGYQDRALQIRFQEARQYWTPILERYGELREFEIELAALEAEQIDKFRDNPLYRLIYG